MPSPDPRTGRLTVAGNEGIDGDAVEASVGPGVADAEVDAGDDDVAGGVVADAQALISSPTTMVVASRESEGRISDVLGTVHRLRRSAVRLVTSTRPSFGGESHDDAVDWPR
jgi:hypothetical protein